MYKIRQRQQQIFIAFPESPVLLLLISFRNSSLIIHLSLVILLPSDMAAASHSQV